MSKRSGNPTDINEHDRKFQEVGDYLEKLTSTEFVIFGGHTYFYYRNQLFPFNVGVNRMYPYKSNI